MIQNSNGRLLKHHSQCQQQTKTFSLSSKISPQMNGQILMLVAYKGVQLNSSSISSYLFDSLDVFGVLGFF
jgi:hypothetical protein